MATRTFKRRRVKKKTLLHRPNKYRLMAEIQITAHAHPAPAINKWALYA
jgi:hypothetical protein